MKSRELLVEQVFGLHAGLVGGHDGELAGQHRRCGSTLPCATAICPLGQQLPQGQGLAVYQFMDHRCFAGGGITQRLQQTALQLGEDMPLLSIVTRLGNLATQGKPLLAPGTQAFGRGAVAFIARVKSFIGLPGFQATFDIALEHFSQVVVAVKLVFVGNASEGVNGVKSGHGSGSGRQT